MSEQNCAFCQHPIGPGPFCAQCGADIERGRQSRRHAYAAAPHQRVLAPHVISTLFPHLSRRGGRTFAIAMAVFVLLLIILSLLRFTGPSVALASLALPLLYLIYLWEVRVYGERPELVFLATVLLGAVLGAIWAYWTGHIVSQAHLLTLLPHRDTGGNDLKTALLIPLGAQVLMLIGPILLLVKREDSEGLDGYTFGAASALGFVLGATIVDLLPELQTGLVAVTSSWSFVTRDLQRGLIDPVVDALTTGLVAGSIWLRRFHVRTQGQHWITGVAPTVVTVIVVQMAMGANAVYVHSVVLATVISLAIAALLLLWTRLALHHLLLAEAGARPGSPACSDCGHEMDQRAFCSYCGLAARATSRRGSTPAADTSWLTRDRKALVVGGGVLAFLAVVMGVIALLITPGKVKCEGLACTVAPPGIRQSAQGAPLGQSSGTRTYTSSKYGFSVSYPSDSPPGQEDSQSIEWDGQLRDGSFVGWTYFGAGTGNQSPRSIVDAVQSDQYPDASYVYTIPGADLGYTPGAGKVYDVSVAPDGGFDIHARLIIIAAVRKGTAVVFMGLGSYKRSTPQTDGHPNPADTELVDLGEVDKSLKTVAWPGESVPWSP